MPGSIQTLSNGSLHPSLQKLHLSASKIHFLLAVLRMFISNYFFAIWSCTLGDLIQFHARTADFVQLIPVSFCS